MSVQPTLPENGKTRPKGMDLSKLEPLAKTVLDARTEDPGATVARIFLVKQDRQDCRGVNDHLGSPCSS